MRSENYGAINELLVLEFYKKRFKKGTLRIRPRARSLIKAKACMGMQKKLYNELML